MNAIARVCYCLLVVLALFSGFTSAAFVHFDGNEGLLGPVSGTKSVTSAVGGGTRGRGPNVSPGRLVLERLVPSIGGVTTTEVKPVTCGTGDVTIIVLSGCSLQRYPQENVPPISTISNTLESGPPDGPAVATSITARCSSDVLQQQQDLCWQYVKNDIMAVERFIFSRVSRSKLAIHPVAVP